ncbi:MAG: 3'-5' exonuclease [Candidatus Sericytochromatia bacterium]|nr:3'-5' exonuclease [Candidatus Tanganyikabacteria bacterium]
MPQDHEYIVFDVETTGLSPSQDALIEVAAMRFTAGGATCDSFHALVRPPRDHIPHKIQELTGIRPQDVRDAHGPDRVLPDFRRWLGDGRTPMLAHNAVFDLDFLGPAMARMGLDLPAAPVFDTLEMARALLPDLVNHKLVTVGQALGLDSDVLHRADADGALLKDIFLALGRLAGLGTPEAIAARFRPLRFQATPQPRIEPELLPVPHAPPGFEGLKQAIANATAIRFVYQGGRDPGLARTIVPTRLGRLGQNLYIKGIPPGGSSELTYRLELVSDWQVLAPAPAPSPPPLP